VLEQAFTCRYSLFSNSLTFALARMSVSLSAVQYFDNTQSLNYTTSPYTQHRTLSRKPENMYQKLKKTFSTRKASKSSNNCPIRDAENAGQMLDNTLTATPVSKRSSGSRNSGLTPPSRTNPLASASPATRRPSKYYRSHIRRDFTSVSFRH
jgi:hypothetical protein